MNETIQCNHWNNHVDTQTYIIRHSNLRRYNNNGDDNDERSNFKHKEIEILYMPTRVEIRRAPQYKRKSNRPNRDDKVLKCLFLY